MPSKDYFQISAQILAGLLCSRPLVSLYVHDPGLDEVRLAHRAGEFLPAGRRAELIEACGRGGLLLSRADHEAFVGHMSANLGPALFCSGLGQGEIAEILRRALKARIEAFFSRPLKPALDDLRRDLSTLVEYVQTEPGRMDALLRGLDREYGLANHSLNCLLIGLALCLAGGEKGLARPDIESLALGLALHDLGMALVPAFVSAKTGFLMPSDRDSLRRHVESGLNMLNRLEVSDRMVIDCVREHHERLDGSGYPRGLAAGDIGLAGRVCAVADSYCASISERPYKRPKDAHLAALALLGDGARYDPDLVRVLCLLADRGGGPFGAD